MDLRRDDPDRDHVPDVDDPDRDHVPDVDHPAHDHVPDVDDRDHVTDFDEDDPEPDVLPGAGWAAHDLSLVPGRPRVRPTETPAKILARAVATTLITWRLDRGLTQRDVARRFGVTQSWLSRLERARSPVSFELLHRVAAITGSSITMTVSPDRRRRPARRLMLGGRLPGVSVDLVVDGPAARRSVASPSSSGGRAPWTIS